MMEKHDPLRRLTLFMVLLAVFGTALALPVSVAGPAPGHHPAVPAPPANAARTPKYYSDNPHGSEYMDSHAHDTGQT